MKVTFSNKGDFSKTIKFLNKLKNVKINEILSKTENDSFISQLIDTYTKTQLKSYYVIQNKKNFDNNIKIRSCQAYSLKRYPTPQIVSIY